MKSLDDIEVKRRLEQISLRGISMLDPFVGMAAKNNFKCIKCLYCWSANFNNVYRGRGCIQCSGNYIPPSKITENIKSLELRGIKLIDNYTKASAVCKFQCLKCDHVWKSQFTQVFNNRGCNNCAINARAKKRSLPSEEIKTRIENIGHRGIKMIDKYAGSLYKNHFCCTNCSHVWTTTFDAVHRGTGCAKCKGMILTDTEKINSIANDMLRLRLSAMFHKKVTPTKVYRDINGEKNLLWNNISEHWHKEYRLISKKPDSGVWHLDHIIPVSWFDAYDIEQLKLCWNHKNVRWLSKSENDSRGNRMRSQDVEILTDWHHSAIDKASYAKSFSTS